MALEDERSAKDSNRIISLEAMPKAVLQAIYHEVTGKVENYRDGLRGNVIITGGDIERLYEMINDQLNLYLKVVEPTVTVVVKHVNEKASTYSSWERFKALRVDNHEITSDLTLKVELLVHLPETPRPQRCVINILLDSSLPVIQRDQEEAQEAEAFGFVFLMRSQWRSVKMSIDSIDFLLAKSFMNVTREWFSTLKRTPLRPLNDILLKNYQSFRRLLGQAGRIGMAVFLGAYVYFSRGTFTLAQTAVAVAIGLLIWSFFIVLEPLLTNKLFKRISYNIVPAIILLSKGDHDAYEEITKHLNSPLNTFAGFVATLLLNITINIGSSFLYSHFSAR